MREGYAYKYIEFINKQAHSNLNVMPYYYDYAVNFFFSRYYMPNDAVQILYSKQKTLSKCCEYIYTKIYDDSNSQNREFHKLLRGFNSFKCDSLCEI